MLPGFETHVWTVFWRSCPAAWVRAYRGVVAISTLGCLACSTSFDVVAERVPAEGSASAGASAADGSEVVAVGGVSEAPTPGSAAPPCGGDHPRVVWTSPVGTALPTCPASFARGRMSYALCSCGDSGILGQLRTEAFDSRAGGKASGAAAVGFNGQHAGHALLAIDGSLTVAAPSSTLLASLEVRGDLRFNGALTVAGPLQVTRDAWFGNAVAPLTVATIGRDVHHQAGLVVDSRLSAGTSGRLLAEEFSIARPCRCDTNDVLDWLNVIEHASGENDNDLIQLSSAPASTRAGVELTLPCGAFYLDELKTIGDIRLRVTGRAALFVAGDVSAVGTLQVDLAPDAELDWFVGGNLDLSRALRVGDPTRPSVLRIYVAGTAVSLVPQAAVAASLYAPLSDVVLLGDSDFYGSVFAHTLSALGDVYVHYDAAVQRAGDACELAAPSRCSGCAQCEIGLTCVAGECVSCSQDSDCCSPQICDGGRCVALMQ